MAFLIADCSAGDAYIWKDFADQTEIWVTLEAWWSSTAQGVWNAQTYAGDFVEVRVHDGATPGSGNVQEDGVSLGVGGSPSVLRWYQDSPASHFGPSATFDVHYTVEMYYKFFSPNGTSAVYIDGTLIQSINRDPSVYEKA